MRKRLNHIAGTVMLLLLGLAIFSCEPIVTTFDDVEDAIAYQAASITTPPASVDTLKVVTWNIKFGGGGIDFWFDCWGDRVLMTQAEVEANMDRVVAEIEALDPDILLLQEVDVSSKRSAYVDQLQYILDRTDLNYGVYASMWQAQVVPSDGIGRINTGNAILSRWPLADAKRIALALRTDQDALTTYFYLRRNLLKARVELPGQNKFYALAIHTAAFSQDGTKKKHIDRFKDELDAIDSAGGWFVAGGDLNTIPPDPNSKQFDFDDSVCEAEEFQADDYREEVEGDWMNPLYAAYDPAIPLDDYVADNARYYSHTTKSDGAYNRKLDYLFTNLTWVAGTGKVHKQEMGAGLTRLSDHAPVAVKMVLP